ncbi:hypothetical protein OAW23_07330 [Flavobacteriales bacterium]|nr:hypothetical protein [Flavobacteriales bacterium]
MKKLFVFSIVCLMLIGCNSKPEKSAKDNIQEFVESFIQNHVNSLDNEIVKNEITSELQDSLHYLITKNNFLNGALVKFNKIQSEKENDFIIELSLIDYKKYKHYQTPKSAYKLDGKLYVIVNKDFVKTLDENLKYRFYGNFTNDNSKFIDISPQFDFTFETKDITVYWFSEKDISLGTTLHTMDSLVSTNKKILY